MESFRIFGAFMVVECYFERPRSEVESRLTL